MAPPPPALVGVYSAAVGAWAKPERARSRFTNAAVRPSPTSLATKARRDTRPALTAPSRSRNSASFMEPPWNLRRPHADVGSRLPVPVPQIPQIVVPATHPRRQLAGDCRNSGAVDNRDHYRVADHEVIHLDEECRALNRVEPGFGRSIGLVVFFVAPACDVAPLPFVLLGRGLPRVELTHEDPGIGLAHRRGKHLQISIKFRVGVRVGHVR